VNYYYDNASRLYKVAQGSANTLIGYDNANQRSTLTLPNGIVLTYGYDNDSRINSMSYQVGTTSVGNLTYQYDAAGRRTQLGGSLAATGFPQAISSAVYDVSNELTNWNGTTIGYDANGNIQNDGVASYSWNARNQLSGRGATSFQYDAYGRRTLNAAGKNLLYEGWDVGQELSGSTPVTNRVLGGVDEFFSRVDSGVASSPITDALGSVLALTNSSGKVTTQYGYDPFGNATNYGGTSTNVFQYTGRESDGNGLYFYRARYYSPGLGRFVSEDPARFWGDSTNFYAYVGNEPTDFSDPDGLCKEPSRFVICAKAYYGVGTAATRIGTAVAAFPFPKSWTGLPRALGSGKFTNLLSWLSLGRGTAASGSNLGRMAGRVAVPVAIASGVIDAAALSMCTADYVPKFLYTIAKYDPF
jgi:RHS repeat-associated protein